MASLYGSLMAIYAAGKYCPIWAISVLRFILIVPFYILLIEKTTERSIFSLSTRKGVE